MKSRDKKLAGVAGIVQMFEHSLPPLHELPAMRALIEEVAADCAHALRGIASSEFAMTLNKVECAPLNATMAGQLGAVCSLFLIPEWKAQGLVSFSPALLFQLLESMFGGAAMQHDMMPNHKLTQLERNIAGQIATVIFDQLQLKLNSFTAFELRLVDVEQLEDASTYEKNATEYILIYLRVGATDEYVVIAMPAKGLERIRDRFTSTDDENIADLDPDWRRQFQLSVTNTQVQLVATCSGPKMLLADVSRLKVGSLLEFDEANLQNASVEIAGDRIFEGRLGQTRGFFTICLETPADRYRANDRDNLLA